MVVAASERVWNEVDGVVVEQVQGGRRAARTPVLRSGGPVIAATPLPPMTPIDRIASRKASIQCHPSYVDRALLGILAEPPEIYQQLPREHTGLLEPRVGKNLIWSA